jgi:hypothetical protein
MKDLGVCLDAQHTGSPAAARLQLLSEAHARTLASAVQCVASTGTNEPAMRIIEGQAVVFAGSACANALGPRMVVQLEPPFRAVLYGGDHWTQWRQVLQSMQRNLHA